MQRVLITGANKGIGLALVRACLQREGVFVYLGSRNAERGEIARRELVAEVPAWADRVSVVPLDVARDSSVAEAARTVKSSLGDGHLFGIVNNAGMGFGDAGLTETLEVNTRGIHRVCTAFLPLLQPNGGRIVNVTSAAGPNFVAACSPERQRFFLRRDIEWGTLSGFMDECTAVTEESKAFEALGLGDGNPYGLSKACAGSLTMLLAREHRDLLVNACTPGFIETDLTRGYAEKAGKSPAEMGMKPPEEGTRSAMFLLFGDPGRSGSYYGSDAERSPFDRYRAPGTEPYTGD